MRGVLSGTRVVQVGTGVAGGHAARLLADLGAEVEVVTVATADSASRAPELGFLDAGKTFGGLSFRGEGDLTAVLDSAADAEIVICAFDSFYDDGEVASLRERLLEARAGDRILALVTEFGPSGPYAGFRGTELVAAALGGWAYGVGDADREPLRPPGWNCHLMAGVYAAVGVMAAVYHRAVAGEGGVVDVAVMDTVVWTQMNITTNYEYSGSVARRTGDLSPMNHPQGIYRSKDGMVGVNVLYYVEWDRFVELVGHPELAEDPRMATPLSRAQHAAALDEIIIPFVAARTSREIYELAQSHKIPFAIVQSTEELLASPQLAARGFWYEAPVGGAVVRIPTMPFLVSGQRPVPEPMLEGSAG